MVARKKGVNMELITSKNNSAVVSAAKLSDKKYRERTGTFAFEGIKLFREAKKAGADFKQIFITQEAYEKYRSDFEGIDEKLLVLVSDVVYEKLSFENAPQGVFCVCAYYKPKTAGEASFVVLLDGVADPGNFGAVLRSADAFGVDVIYAGAGSADLYNPKTVRACMGSIFRMDVRRADDLANEVLRLREEGFRIYATALDARSEDIRNVDFKGKVGFVIGNEGHGVSKAVLEACTGSVIIPMSEGPESLNAAVASGVVMWEAARVRLQ